MQQAGALRTRWALAVAMPSSADDVENDLRQPNQHDYARFCQGPLEGMTSSLIWAAHFQPVAQALEAVAPRLKDLCVEVVRDATLADVGALLRRFPVVTILGHWKGHLILPADIRDVARFARRILNDDSRVCAQLRVLIDVVELKDLADAPDPPEMQCRRRLADLLNEAINAGTPLFQINTEGLAFTELEFLEFNRQQLDVWFEGLLYPGNRLELRDGLFEPSQLAALIPPDYAGTIHVALCNSALMQRSISDPRWRVLANKAIIAPLPTLAVYRTVIETMAETRLGYADTWLTILTELRNADLTGDGNAVPHGPLAWLISRTKRLLGRDGDRA
jgi:hypothetical protein